MGGASLLGTLSYPFTRLQDAFSKDVDDFFEDTQKNRQRRAKEQTLISQCSGNRPPGTLEHLSLLLKVKACVGCVPLGNISCTDRSCECSRACPDACDRVCPATFEIMEKARERSIPYKKNTLDVINSRSYFDNPVVFGGYCHGITATRKAIAALARFEPNEAPKDQSGNIITDPVELENFYQNILEDMVLNGKVRKIPGLIPGSSRPIQNIRQLSGNEFVQPALKKVIRKSFTRQNILNPWSLETAATWESLDKEEFKSERKKIERHIQATGTAQISFGTGGGGAHTIEIYHTHDTVVRGRKATIMCTIDENHFLSQNQNPHESIGPSKIVGGKYCPHKMTVFHDDWSYKYNGKTHNNSFHVDRHEERLLRRNIDGVVNHCKKERGCKP